MNRNENDIDEEWRDEKILRFGNVEHENLSDANDEDSLVRSDSIVVV